MFLAKLIESWVFLWLTVNLPKFFLGDFDVMLLLSRQNPRLEKHDFKNSVLEIKSQLRDAIEIFDVDC
jgi:hypothetical protein